MTKQSLHSFDDFEFGKGGPYAWPGDFEQAEDFVTCCTVMDGCLECNFYSGYDLDDLREWYPGITEWPTPYLFASAAYYWLTQRFFAYAAYYGLTQRTGMQIYDLEKFDAFSWSPLFFLLLVVGEPLFQMIHRNGWYEPNKEAIRKGFMYYLMWDNDIFVTIEWSYEKGLFEIHESKDRKGRVSPDSLSRCLEFVGVNETVARLAVEEMIETESLSPLLNALFPATDTADTEEGSEKK